MKPSKYDRLASQQTSIARKVLEATPLQEPWRPNQILAEMHRLGYGTSTTMAVVNGCLGSLKASGLVREPAPNCWIRVQPRDTTHVDVDEASDPDHFDPHTPEVQEENIMSKQTTMERMAALATQARSMAEQMRALACHIEDTALEAEAEVQRAKDELVKFEQMKSLLASLK